MKRLIRGALLGIALSVVFKKAQRRGLLPRHTQLQQAVRRLKPRPRGNGELEGLTKAQLYERAQAEDLPGRSEMRKDELIAALRAKRRRQDG